MLKVAHFAMALDDITRELCEKLLSSPDDEEAVRLAEELRTVLHNHIEALRAKLPTRAGDEPLGLPEPAAHSVSERF